MDRRIATARTKTCARGLALALALAASAQQAPAQPVPAPLTKACQPGNASISEDNPLPNVAAALAQRKTLRILAMGAAPGRISRHGSGYTEVIEAMLQGALKGVNVVLINRGISGELAGSAAVRMKIEVALDDPDLVLWQVGTNDALAFVPVESFITTVKDQIDWLRAHKVDVVLVGLQFAPEMLREAHYKELREALRKLAAQEKVIIIRFFEAMQIINQAAGKEPVSEQFERDEAGYNCLAQYVARAITLGTFAKAGLPRREPTPPGK